MPCGTLDLKIIFQIVRLHVGTINPIVYCLLFHFTCLYQVQMLFYSLDQIHHNHIDLYVMDIFSCHITNVNVFWRPRLLQSLQLWYGAYKFTFWHAILSSWFCGLLSRNHYSLSFGFHVHDKVSNLICCQTLQTWKNQQIFISKNLL